MNLCRAVMLEYLAYTPSASRKHCVPKLVLSSSAPFRPNIHSFHLIGPKAQPESVSLTDGAHLSLTCQDSHIFIYLQPLKPDDAYEPEAGENADIARHLGVRNIVCTAPAQ